MRKIAVFILFLLIPMVSLAESIQVKPKGEFAAIDVEVQNEMLEKILSGDETAIDKVLSEPKDFNPVVLYGLSSALFNAGKKDQAAFWFYVGQLRGRSDANKSLDVSARQAIGVLNQRFGGPINQYAMQDIAKLKEIVVKAVRFDEETGRNYDPRWISLHGMDVFLEKEKVAFEPEPKWSEIDKRTRTEYYDGFNQAMQQLERERLQP